MGGVDIQSEGTAAGKKTPFPLYGPSSKKFFFGFQFLKKHPGVQGLYKHVSTWKFPHRAHIRVVTNGQQHKKTAWERSAHTWGWG